MATSCALDTREASFVKRQNPERDTFHARRFTNDGDGWSSKNRVIPQPPSPHNSAQTNTPACRLA
jgi:hypothetical protein